MFKLYAQFWLFVALSAYTISSIEACGCYGAASCRVNQNAPCDVNDFGCDCCPPCNSCPQLLAGCASYAYSPNVSLQTPPTFRIRQPITPVIFRTSVGTGNPGYLDTTVPACISPSLPAGLVFAYSNGSYALSGTPTEVVPPTNYTIIVKGSASLIFKTVARFGISDPASSFTCPTTTAAATTGNAQVCEVGQMRCVTSETYQTCANDRNVQPVWGPTQSCATQTTCKSSGKYIYCT